MTPRPRIVALVAAHDEAARVGATVEAIRSLSDVDEVVVVDDASGDGTAAVASAAGGRVLIAPRRVGKGEALEGALHLLSADVYLLLDADLGPSAKEASALLGPVVAGDADIAVGILPPQKGHGGFRLVKRMSGMLIRRLSGFRAVEPMSGQRVVSREAMAAVRPLARGFGVELGMTVDAVRAGLRVVEVPVGMEHAPTGRDLQGFLHRLRQGLDHLQAALPRALRLR